MNENLDVFIHGLYAEDEQHKLASSDLSHLSFTELEEVIGIDIESDFVKEAYIGDQDHFLKEFAGTPLYAQAIALCDQEIKLEVARIKRQQEEALNRKADVSYAQGGQIRLQKKMLQLKLHKLRAEGALPPMDDDDDDESGSDSILVKSAAAEPATVANTGNVKYVGATNTGEKSTPAWPRAAFGVDSAGRRATPEEEAGQNTDTTRASLGGGMGSKVAAGGLLGAVRRGAKLW